MNVSTESTDKDERYLTWAEKYRLRLEARYAKYVTPGGRRIVYTRGPRPQPIDRRRKNTLEKAREIQQAYLTEQPRPRIRQLAKRFRLSNATVHKSIHDPEYLKTLT
jgi:hypothetical protein